MRGNAEGGRDEIYESGDLARHIHADDILWTYLILPENGEYDELADLAAEEVFHEELDGADGPLHETLNRRN